MGDYYLRLIYSGKVDVGLICWSVIGVFVMWASTFILYFFISKSEERGQFGDMFGAVNALM